MTKKQRWVVEVIGANLATAEAALDRAGISLAACFEPGEPIDSLEALPMAASATEACRIVEQALPDGFSLGPAELAPTVG